MNPLAQPADHETPTRISVSDIMSPRVKHAHPADPVPDVHGAMRMLGVRHMPVVDGDGHLVGILSERDLFRAWGARDRRVEEVMTKRPAVVTPHDDAAEAAARMFHEKIGSLVVVDAERVVGILTESDLLRVAYVALRAWPVAQNLRRGDAGAASVIRGCSSS